MSDKFIDEILTFEKNSVYNFFFTLTICSIILSAIISTTHFILASKKKHLKAELFNVS